MIKLLSLLLFTAFALMGAAGSMFLAVLTHGAGAPWWISAVFAFPALLAVIAIVDRWTTRHIY